MIPVGEEKRPTHCGQCSEKFTESNPYFNMTMNSKTGKPVPTCQNCRQTKKLEIVFIK
ncbi:MAG: hypothetical protein PHT40_00525 [Patescibacteria group bacterium]|nr:hypothetical protein [Patescibacteria group bacterium]